MTAIAKAKAKVPDARFPTSIDLIRALGKVPGRKSEIRNPKPE